MDIIELSTYNSEVNNNNSTWTNTFSPITINTGSEIGLKSCFIDLKSIQNSYGNITLDEDVDISMTVGFYQMFTTDVTTFANALDADGEPYVAREDDDTLIQNTINTTIPAGNYTPEVLAEIITRNITKIKYESLLVADNNPSLLIQSKANHLAALKDTPTFSGDKHNWFFEDLPLGEAIVENYKVGTPVTIEYMENGSRKTQLDVIQTIDTTTGEFTVAIAVTSTFPLVLAKVYLTNPIDINLCNHVDTSIKYKNRENVFLGSSQFALVYNLEQSNRYQFQYLHTPYYTGSNNVESSGFQLLKKNAFTGGTLSVVDSQGGVFFTDLQPRSFWEDTLGFDLDTLLVVENTTNNSLVTPLERGKNITSNFFGLDNMFDKSKHMAVPDAELFTQSSATVPIRSVNTYGTTQDSGYYLIQISGLNTDYTQDTKKRHNIMGIISRQYNQNGYVSDWGSGSLRYINKGEPFLLSSLEISILDPKTKKPVDNLGINNSVFLEVFQSENK